MLLTPKNSITINKSQYLEVKGEITLIIPFFLIQITVQQCMKDLKKESLILKGYHKNVLQKQAGAVISSRLDNYFFEENEGSCLRDNTYKMMPNPNAVPSTRCPQGQTISLSLMQKYYLNTLIIWLWEYDFVANRSERVYDLIIYIVFDQVKKQIYENKNAKRILRISFPDQFVEEIILLCVGGNTYNPYLHITKAEVYYKFQ
ncbi:unnamed protein product [Paramecium octaurelia]|uniref:Uncharacterized protein n=1 Tax=Paramecium octaurelia TaxID=43137 RepID=A0A8S1YDN5_PAROT|nr:unnamed protein product [Paramecium octaurelia]